MADRMRRTQCRRHLRLPRRDLWSPWKKHGKFVLLCSISVNQQKGLHHRSFEALLGELNRHCTTRTKRGRMSARFPFTRARSGQRYLRLKASTRPVRCTKVVAAEQQSACRRARIAVERQYRTTLSRQYLVRLTDRGKLPAGKVDSHRRLRASDVAASKVGRDARRTRRWTVLPKSAKRLTAIR